MKKRRPGRWNLEAVDNLKFCLEIWFIMLSITFQELELILLDLLDRHSSTYLQFQKKLKEQKFLSALIPNINRPIVHSSSTLGPTLAHKKKHWINNNLLLIFDSWNMGSIVQKGNCRQSVISWKLDAYHFLSTQGWKCFNRTFKKPLKRTFKKI